MVASRKLGSRWRLPAVVVLAVALVAVQPAVLAAEPPSPAWRATGVTLPSWGSPNRTYLWCVDGSRADVVLVPVVEAGSLGPAGTYALNWRATEAIRLSERLFNQCDPVNGLLYRIPNRFWEPDQPILQFSRRDPHGRPVERIPLASTVGTALLVAYADSERGESARLWVSDDGGATWQERGQQLPQPIQFFLVSPLDARLIYAQTRERVDPTTFKQESTIYFSPDAGQTWDERATVTNGYLGLFPAPAPVDTLSLRIPAGYGSGAYTIYHLSTDGGRTFRLASDTAPNVTELLHTSDGILRLSRPRVHPAMPQPPYRLDRSTDGGATWQAVPLPAPVHSVYQAPAAPDTLVLAVRTGEYQTATPAWWYTHDGGRTWRQAGAETTDAAICVGKSYLRITPYLPLTMLGVRQTDPDCLRASTGLMALDLPGARASVTAGVLPNGVPDGFHFQETRHNLVLSLNSRDAVGHLTPPGYPRLDRQCSVEEGNRGLGEPLLSEP